MKIFEILDKPSETKKLDFDLVEDLIFFIYNDQEFYRTRFYPAEVKFKKLANAGTTPRPSSFKSIVQDAYAKYYDKFKTEGLSSSLPDEALSQTCSKLHAKVLEDHDAKK